MTPAVVEEEIALTALVAVVAAAGMTPMGVDLCHHLVDVAVDTLGPLARAETALFAEVCAGCRMCPRGQMLPELGEG